MQIVMTLLFELHLKTKVSEIRKCVFRRLAQAQAQALPISRKVFVTSFRSAFGQQAAHPTLHIASNVFRIVRPSPVGQQYVASLLQFCPKFSPGNLFSGSAAGWATKSTYAAAILQSLHRVYTLHSIC